MMHPATQAELKKALDRAIGESKTWSDVAHKTFAEMAERARDDVVTKGDLSFMWQFRKDFGITEPVQPLNGYVPESKFSTLLLTISTHFRKFAHEYELANKRATYMEMLRSGRKDEFLVILRSHLGKVDADFNLTQDVWRVFNDEEKARQQREKDEENRRKLEMFRQHQDQQRIEQEARRRIEQEAFELAVQAKMRELKK